MGMEVLALGKLIQMYCPIFDFNKGMTALTTMRRLLFCMVVGQIKTFMRRRMRKSSVYLAVWLGLRISVWLSYQRERKENV